MYEELIPQYDSLVAEYKEIVVDRFSKVDFIEYNEILFSAHSCAIEGNSFSVDETRTLKEKGLGMIPHGKTLFEAFEILDHFQAYEYLLNNLDKPLTEELLKETHRLLTEHTLEYKTRNDEVPSKPGEYTTVDMCAGDTIFGEHEKLIRQVPRLLESTQSAIDSGEVHPMVIAAKFHGYYEYLHPFRDGNGRLGRLMSNFILLKMGQPLLIIPSSHREEYIAALKYIKKERTDEFLIDFFFKTSINRLQYEISEKKNLTDNFIDGFRFVSDVKNGK
ncbi:Fic family protein [Bacteroides caecigallinarum]|uniref:Fic family protein n=1 Tax=Bacteroides caecigallinarum TaxID=1411144 RepID=UPI001F22253D|nr:Fic family protein [Bacteroides caecigallinarum]MCF2736634.1 Fic family protein [Bacteroides caecigallinarum]